MKILIKTLITLSAFLVSSTSTTAFAEVYNKDQLQAIIATANVDAVSDGLTIERVIYAEGIQSHNLQINGDGDKEWMATGPLASLYDYDPSTGKLSDKIGTHYQHKKPAWEFFGDDADPSVEKGRVIAASAAVTPMGDSDVAWLKVLLQQLPEHLDYVTVYRVATDGGVKLSDVSNYNVRCNKPNNKCAYETGASDGTGYRTIYLFAR